MEIWWAGRPLVAVAVMASALVLLGLALVGGRLREAAVIGLLAGPLAWGLWLRRPRRRATRRRHR